MVGKPEAMLGLPGAEWIRVPEIDLGGRVEIGPTDERRTQAHLHHALLFQRDGADPLVKGNPFITSAIQISLFPRASDASTRALREERWTHSMC